MLEKDGKYSKKKVEALAKSTDQGRDFFQREFPGYTITEIKPEYYEETGWHIYLKMWKKPGEKLKNRKKGRKKRE